VQNPPNDRDSVDGKAALPIGRREPLLVFPANDVETTGMAVDATLPQDWLAAQLADAEVSSREDGRFVGRLSRSGKADVVVRGRVRAKVSVPCARCLASSPVDVDTELALLLRPRAEAKSPNVKARPKPEPAAVKASSHKNREYEFSSEEAEIDEYDGERVVLDPFVREAILLELPSFPLCSEACSGISEPSGPGQIPVVRMDGSVRGVPPATKSDPGLGTRLGAPGSRSSADRRPNPFEALRHLLTEKALPSDDGQGNSARPSAADVRRATRTLQRDKPKIQSSITRSGASGRTKKP
jgi:uncharacterized protein